MLVALRPMGFTLEHVIEVPAIEETCEGIMDRLFVELGMERFDLCQLCLQALTGFFTLCDIMKRENASVKLTFPILERYDMEINILGLSCRQIHFDILI